MRCDVTLPRCCGTLSGLLYNLFLWSQMLSFHSLECHHSDLSSNVISSKPPSTPLCKMSLDLLSLISFVFSIPVVDLNAAIFPSTPVLLLRDPVRAETCLSYSSLCSQWLEQFWHIRAVRKCVERMNRQTDGWMRLESYSKVKGKEHTFFFLF